MNERVSTYQEEVIHIQHQSERLLSINLAVKVQISNTTSEAQLHQVAIYPLVPSSGCLFQPIEGFLQPADNGCPNPGLSTPEVAPHISLPLSHHAEKCGLHII